MMHGPDSPPENILVATDALGATQFISFLHPLTGAIKRGTMRLRLESLHPDNDPAQLLSSGEPPTVVVLSRYALANGERLINRAREMGIPTIFHIDDDLLNIPRSLGEKKYAFHSAPARLEALRRNMNLCDVVYASTRILGDALAASGIRSAIMAGDVYCTIEPTRLRHAPASSVPTIGYMGTGGHSEDLAGVLPAIKAVMDAVPELHFETFGTIASPDMGPLSHRHRHHAPVGNYTAFIEKLASLGWWAGIAPLEDNDFNRCKADTKWVEYSFAGMPTVAAALPVYEAACSDGAGILAASPSQWRDALSALIGNGALRHDMVTKARSKLLARYTHDRLETQILAVIARARHSGLGTAPEPKKELL